jgi:hypothetical protein
VARLLALVLLLLPAPAGAASVFGGSINSPGTNSHNIAGGWPDVLYVWEGLITPQLALGPRVQLRIWTPTLGVGLYARVRLVDHARFDLALLLSPTVDISFAGGTRGTFGLAAALGRGPGFSPSLGVGGTVGLLASIALQRRWELMFGFEVPAHTWIGLRLGGIFGEVAPTLSAGAEHELTHGVSLYGRLGGGPSIAFNPARGGVGGHWQAMFGVQLRY